MERRLKQGRVRSGGSQPQRLGGRFSVAGLADVGLCAGLALCVVGTFLPWVRSGTASRNGYSAGGVLRRLLGVHGLEAVALTALPFLALACAVAVVLVLLGHSLGATPAVWTGRVLALVVAGAAGIGAIAGAAADPTYGVTLQVAGPVAVLVGAASTWFAVVVLVSSASSCRRRGLTESH